MDKWKCRVSSFPETRNEWTSFKWRTWTNLTTINETYSARYKQMVSPSNPCAVVQCYERSFLKSFQYQYIKLYLFCKHTHTYAQPNANRNNSQTNWAILLRIKGTTLALCVFIEHRRQAERECAWTTRFWWWTDYTLFQCIPPLSSTGVPFLLTLDQSFCRDNSENIRNYPIPALHENMHEWIQSASCLHWDVFSTSVLAGKLSLHRVLRPSTTFKNCRPIFPEGLRSALIFSWNVLPRANSLVFNRSIETKTSKKKSLNRPDDKANFLEIWQIFGAIHICTQ